MFARQIGRKIAQVTLSENPRYANFSIKCLAGRGNLCGPDKDDRKWLLLSVRLPFGFRVVM